MNIDDKTKQEFADMQAGASVRILQFDPGTLTAQKPVVNGDVITFSFVYDADALPAADEPTYIAKD